MKVKLMDMGFLAFAALVTSAIIVIVPISVSLTATFKARAVSSDINDVAFALGQMFYSEGIRHPEKVNIKLLEEKYYLKKGYSQNYGLMWLKNQEETGKILAVVYYKGSVNPIKIHKIMRDVVWVDEKKSEIFKDYRKGRFPGKIVEVNIH